MIELIRSSINDLSAKRTKEKKKPTQLRTFFLSFLRSCWNALPNVKFLYGQSFRYYCLDASYERIQMEVATMIHNYLFLGHDKLSFFGHSDDYSIPLMTVQGTS